MSLFLQLGDTSCVLFSNFNSWLARACELKSDLSVASSYTITLISFRIHTYRYRPKMLDRSVFHLVLGGMVSFGIEIEIFCDNLSQIEFDYHRIQSFP